MPAHSHISITSRKGIWYEKKKRRKEGYPPYYLVAEVRGKESSLYFPSSLSGNGPVHERKEKERKVREHYPRAASTLDKKDDVRIRAKKKGVSRPVLADRTGKV